MSTSSAFDTACCPALVPEPDEFARTYGSPLDEKQVAEDPLSLLHVSTAAVFLLMPDLTVCAHRHRALECIDRLSPEELISAYSQAAA